MAAINFPSGASNGATHYENGKLWTYDGTSWNITAEPVTLITPLDIADAGTGSTVLYLIGSNATSGAGVALSTDNSLKYNPNTNQLSISSGSLAASGITIGSASNTINTASGNLTLDSVGGTVNVNDNLIVAGDLTVNGTTSIVNSTITSLVDPIIVLGAGAGNTHPSSDDNKDRGIEFRYVSGTAKTGFFGFDDSTGKFTFIPDGSNTGEVFSGTAGTAIFATVEGNLLGTATTSTYSHQSGYAITSGLATTSDYSHQSGYAITSGLATTSQNIVINQTSDNSNFYIPFTSSISGSGVALSSGSGLSFNPSSNTLITGNLTGTLQTANQPNVTGLGVVTSGTWSATAITSKYGGTGYSVYNLGDLLVGTANSSLAKLNVGSPNSILIASTFSGYGISWASLNPTYGAFASTSTQQVTAADTATLVTFNTTFESNNVSITPTGSGSTTRIYIHDTGVFNIQISAQTNLANGNQAQKGDFWFKLNGSDVPISNTISSVEGKDYESLLALNFVSTILSGSYVEIAFSSSDSNYRIVALSNLTSPTRPDIPSMILTVVPVSNIVPGTAIGISGIATLNNLTAPYQALVTGSSGNDFNISSSSDTHTFNIPSASATARGLVTTTTQTFAGAKTFSGTVSVSNATVSTSTTTGALVVTGGVGIGGSLYVDSFGSSISGVVLSNGVVHADLTGTATTSNYSHQSGYAITSGLATTSQNINLTQTSNNSNFFIPFTSNTSGSGVALSAGTGLSFNPSTNTLTTGNITANLTGNVTGTATTAQNVSISSAGNNTNHLLTFTLSQSTSGSALSTNSTLVYNPITDILSVSGISVTSNTSSTSTTSGALIISGGVGLAGNAFIGGTINITNSTGSGSSTSGALVVSGGVGISGDTYVGRNLDVRNTATIRSLTSGRVTFAGTNGLLSDDTNFTYSTTTDALTLNGATSSPNIIISKAIASLGSSFGIRMINSNNATTGSQIFYSPYFEIMGSAFSPITGGSAYTTRVGLRTISSRGQLSGGLEFPSVGFNLEYSIDKGTSAYNNTFWGSVGDTIPRSNPSTTISGQINGSSYGIGTSSFPAFLLYNDGLDAAGNQITSVSPSLVLIGSEYYVSEDGYKNFQARQYVGPGTAISSPMWYLDLGTNISLSRENLAQPPYTNVITAQRFGPVTISQLIGATSTSYGALVVNGGLGLSGNAFIGGTVTLTNTTNSTTSSSGSLVLSGGAGIALSASIGGRLQLFNSSLYTAFVSSQSGVSTVYTLPATTPSTGTSVLQSTTAGVLSWVPMTSGSASPAGQNDGDIQFKRSSSFGATSNLNYLENSSELRIDKFLFSGDPASSSSAALRITGTNATFTGSVNGTYLAINTISGFTGNIIDAQVNGTSKFTLSNTSASISTPLSVTDATNSTTSSSGALTITGGAGIAKSLSLGGRLQLFNSSLYTAFVSIQSGVSTVYTLPATTPSTGTSVLQSDTIGNLSWVPMTASGGGAGTVNNGTTNSVAYYSSTGAGVTGNNQLQITGTGVTIGFETNAAFSDNGSLTGALTVAGGVGIGGTLFVASKLGVGGTLDYTATNAIAVFTGSVNSYNQVIIHNHSSGNNASSDYIVSNDLSTDNSVYGDFGINSSGWAATTQAFNVANATYLASSGGDLAIGSLTANNIRFFYNNGVNDVANFNGSDFGVFYGTNSTGTTTGAVNIRGGLGITGNAFIGGTVTITDTTTSTGTTTGALVISGGAGFGKTINVAGNIGARAGFELRAFNPGDTNYSSFKYTGSVDTPYTLPTTYPSTGTSVLQSDINGLLSWVPSTGSPGGSGTVNSGTAGSAAFYASDGTAVSGSSDIFILPGSGVTINNTTRSTSTTTGALVIKGGVGIGGSLWIGGTLVLGQGRTASITPTGDVIVRGGLAVTNNIYINNNNPALSESDQTAPLHVRGGATIRGNAFIGSSMSVYGTDELNISASSGALSCFGGFYASKSAAIGGSVYIAGSLNTGLRVRDPSYFTGGLITEVGGITVGAGINISTTATINGLNNISSSDRTSGALYVKGGAGIESSLSIGRFFYQGFIGLGTSTAPYNSQTYYWPLSMPTVSGQALVSDINGNWSWASTAGFGTVNQKSISIFYPSTSDEITLMHTYEPITILQFETVNTGSGSALTYFVNFNSDRSSLIGTTVVLGGTAHTAGLAATTTGQAVTTFTNASVGANQFIWLRIGSVTGTMNEFHFTMHYRKT